MIAHVEAGLRSFDRAMPEEINRVITDHLSDLLFVTEESGIRNLQNEGISPEAIHFVGNTMIDSLREHEAKADSSSVLEQYGLKKDSYALLTLHRAANVDGRDSFIEILEGLRELAECCRIIFPAHPRTQKQIRELGLEPFLSGSNASSGIHMIEPQAYVDFICLMKHARLVATDSGGVQEETTALGVPCVTLRENTERPVTIECGTNVLGGTRRETIMQAVRRQLARRERTEIPELWDGRAASRIVGILVERLMHNLHGAASSGSGDALALSASASGQM